MIPIGAPYHPAGKLNVRSILSAAILGVVTALVVALIFWAWELSSIPTLFLITPLAQGVAIGTVLAALVGRLRLRHARLLWTLGFGCGLLSIGMIHYAHYLHFLDEMEATLAAQVEEVKADADLTPERQEAILAAIGTRSGAVGDFVLRQETGHTGFVGFLILRSQAGSQLGKHTIKGPGVWVLWGFEALMVAGIASSMTKVRTKDPFCGDCGDWCSKQRAPIELLSQDAPTLADAVLADDLEAATEALQQPVDPERHKRDAARVTLHSCPHCDQAFADVEGYTIDFDGTTTTTRTLSYLKLIRISPAMAVLLRNPPPAVLVPADGEDLEPIDNEDDEAGDVEA